jgi:acyl carrier protein
MTTPRGQQITEAVSSIGPDTVRELLADSRIFPGLPADLDDDAELVLDSLGLLWLLHEVEQRYGLVVEPTDEEAAGLVSVRRITDYLREAGAGDGR